jgi:hypothetical protein
MAPMMDRQTNRAPAPQNSGAVGARPPNPLRHFFFPLSVNTHRMCRTLRWRLADRAGTMSYFEEVALPWTWSSQST